jgi:hypothetical protein
MGQSLFSCGDTGCPVVQENVKEVYLIKAEIADLKECKVDLYKTVNGVKSTVDRLVGQISIAVAAITVIVQLVFMFLEKK